MVRKLKTNKAPKPEVDAAVAVLLAAKAQYKDQVGKDWNPRTSSSGSTGDSKSPSKFCHDGGRMGQAGEPWSFI